MRRRDLLSVAGVLGVRSVTGATSGPLGELEQRIPDAMAKAQVPGVSIAVVQRGRLVWKRGFGVADVETGRRLDEDTVFQAASMSKPVFAYAVMQLCAQGVMDLDTPLTKYTPDRVLMGDARLESITARHVLSHTSGFQNWRSKDKPLSIAFAPGSKYMYSGEGYWYLQSVVSRLKGRTDTAQCSRYEGDVAVCATDIDEYMRANVLRPLGMKSSAYLWNEKWRAHAARGHDGQGRPLRQQTPRAVDAARYASAGGLLTTASDYARFLMVVMGSGKVWVAEMLRPRVELERTEAYSIAWGLGWRLARTKEAKLFGHGGDNAGFHCLSEACVERKSAFVIMTNGDGGPEFLKNAAPEISARVHGLRR